LENTRGFGLDMKIFFLDNRGIKTLKVEDIGYNVEKQKNYIGDIMGIRVQNVLYFIFIFGK
jgi:hypothetical protein